MSQSLTYKKLRLQPGQQILVLNTSKEYADLIGELPVDLEFVTPDQKEVDFVHLFVRTMAKLDELIQVALGAIRYDGMLWISYPKGRSEPETDLNRDIIWEHLTGSGFRPVMMSSIDNTWSAMRMRLEESVGK